MATYTPNLNLYKPDTTDDFEDFLPEFNNNMDKLDQGGGGGGSNVSWNQILQSGTKIAEITINGTTQDVYAPSGGGGGGHTIVDESGTSLPSETKLQFTDGLQAVDDNVNGKTVVSLAYFAVVGGELCQVYDDGN